MVIHLAALAVSGMSMLGLSNTGRICVVDMGSNSFKLIVGEVADGAYIERHVERKTLGVGDDMSKTGRISESKLKDILETLTEFRSRCEAKGAVSFRAVATAAFREAVNGSHVVEIGKQIRIPVEIASEERESTLAYLTATNGDRNQAVIDNGSRTIELVAKDANGAPIWKVVKLGYRAAYDEFFQNAATFSEAYERMASALARDLGDVQAYAGRQGLVGIELDEMAQYLLKKKNVGGSRIKLSALRKQIEKLKAQDAKKFSALKQEHEIDRVLPRLVAVEYILEHAGYRSVGVVSRELGVGLIIEAGLQQ
jgi:exopolyphosphatase / guanosine-5'-triphosphate,3'-diphosphate pyrophosphatase